MNFRTCHISHGWLGTFVLLCSSITIRGSKFSELHSSSWLAAVVSPQVCAACRHKALPAARHRPVHTISQHLHLDSTHTVVRYTGFVGCASVEGGRGESARLPAFSNPISHKRHRRENFLLLLPSPSGSRDRSPEDRRGRQSQCIGGTTKGTLPAATCWDHSWTGATLQLEDPPPPPIKGPVKDLVAKSTVPAKPPSPQGVSLLAQGRAGPVSSGFFFFGLFLLAPPVDPLS